jgi:hypothetical protein
MRMRELLTRNGLYPLANTIFRLPGTLANLVIFGSQVVIGTGLALMISRPVIPSRFLVGALLVGMVILLLLCLAALGNDLESAGGKLVAARNVLLGIAFQECRCKPTGKGNCHVCYVRGVLEEHFPGAIEELIQKRLNDFAFDETYIPDDLAASYITPEALAYLRERRLGQVGPERFVPLTFTVRKLRK